jgi:serine/threonine protein kinase
MPVVDGVDLASVLLRDGALEPALAVRVTEQLSAALDAAHQRGLVHRDVKPSNALVTPGEFVYLIDFGIAHDASATKLTSTGMTMGTWAYMAPERFSTGVADARGDVYALACVLCECLTGRLAFPGESLQQPVAGHLTMDPPKPSAVNPALPAAFDEVIARGMAKDPDQRYQTAPELASAARQVLTATPASTTPAFIGQSTAPISATQPAFAVAAAQADGINQQPTQMASTALVPPPRAQPPSQPGAAQPGPSRPGRRRVVIGALGGVALLIAGGDRCMGYLHAPNAVRPLVFSAGNWILDLVEDEKCPGGGGPAHTNLTGQYPLPTSPQDPITLLTGHGHWSVTGSCATDTDTVQTFTRTGD